MATHAAFFTQRLVQELGRLNGVDTRLQKRLKRVVRRAAARPAASFPQMMRGDSELEALYRLLNNPRVTLDTILGPHLEATAARAQQQPHDILVPHDTTQFCFSGDVDRKGLGPVSNSGQGFFGHFALAFADDAVRTPLGIIGLQTLIREREPRSDAPKESARWLQTLDAVQQRLDVARTIHLMDREGDWAQLLMQLQQSSARFVVRLCQNRKLEHETAPLFDAFDPLDDVLERDIEVGKRSDRGRRLSAKKLHPARSARTARVSIHAREVVLHNAGSPITLRVVHVLERNPPPGEPAVEWWLATSEPIETAQQLARIVDLYRARWLIEEFFKALKTGCRYEQRQLESAHALLNALAVLAPVAWQMLALRALSRLPAVPAASAVLSDRQLLVLRACARKPLPRNPSVSDILYAIAALGGHLRRNGPPGWSTLGRGMEHLLLFEAGWAAREAEM